MRLVNLRVDGLGAEHTRTLEFGDGVNVVYGASGSGKTAISQLLKSLISGDANARFAPNLSCSADLTYDEDAVTKSLHYRFNGSTASTDGNYPSTTRDANLSPVFFMGGCPVGQVDTLLETAQQLGFPALDTNPLLVSLDELLNEREQLRSHLATLPSVDSVEALQNRRIELEDRIAETRQEIERIHIRRDRHLDEIRSRIEAIQTKHDDAKRTYDLAHMELDDYQRLLEEHNLRRRRERLEFVESRRDALQRVDLQLLQLMECAQQLNRQRNELYHNSSDLYSVLQPLQLSLCERTQLDSCLQEIETMIHGVERKRQQLALELHQAEASDDTYVADDSIVCGICRGSNEKCQSVQTSSSHWEIPKWKGSEIRYSEEHLNMLHDRHRIAKREFDELDSQLSKWKAEHVRYEERDELRRLEQLAAEYRNELEATKSLMDIARQRSQVETRIRSVVEQIEAARSAEEFLRILSRASELLYDISDRRFDDITVHSRKTISVRTEHGRKSWSELACGTQSLIYLCMSVAVAENLRAGGLRFPMILDDLFIQIDSDRDRATANLINKVAADNQQVIVLTRHRHVPQLFDQPGTVQLGLSELTAFTIPVEPAPEPEPKPKAKKPKKKTAKETLKVWEESLHVDAMPSITNEGREALATLQVETLRDLIDLDVDSDYIDWESHGLEQERVRRWQSHANLLCFVPNLRGSDAVLLTACGVRCPATLCEFEAAELDRRIRKFFNAGVRSSVEATRRPSLERLAQWIKWTNRRQSRWTRRCKQRSQRPTPMRSGVLLINRDESDRDDSDSPSNRSSNRGRSGRSSSNSSRSSRNSSERSSSNRSSSRRGNSTDRSERSSRRRNRDGESDGYSRSRRSRSRDESEQRDWDNRERIQSSDTEDYDGDESGELRFYLDLESAIVDAPSIGAKTAERLEEADIYSVQDLLNADPDELADRLDNRRMKAKVIRQWQAEATLVCRVPQMRGHDAQILVACELEDVDAVADMDPHALWGLVQPFVTSKKGQRIIRNGKAPDLDEINEWIQWAQQARTLRAA